jgi:hypothetical protein
MRQKLGKKELEHGEEELGKEEGEQGEEVRKR